MHYGWYSVTDYIYVSSFYVLSLMQWLFGGAFQRYSTRHSCLQNTAFMSTYGMSWPRAAFGSARVSSSYLFLIQKVVTRLVIENSRARMFDIFFLYNLHHSFKNLQVTEP
jgi:hypothetical protein